MSTLDASRDAVLAATTRLEAAMYRSLRASQDRIDECDREIERLVQRQRDLQRQIDSLSTQHALTTQLGRLFARLTPRSVRRWRPPDDH